MINKYLDENRKEDVTYNLKAIQERLRHAKIDMTARYTYESKIINREVANTLEALNPKRQQVAPLSAPSG